MEKRNQKANKKPSFLQEQKKTKQEEKKDKGYVDFMPSGGQDKKKQGKKSPAAPKQVGQKRAKIFKGEGQKKQKKENGDKTISKAKERREKYKVSELVKSLRINYNKLIMKKKDMEGENKSALKQDIVKDCMTLIKDDYKPLIFKHDGCRIL